MANKRVIALAVIPIENFAASGTTNDYFYPNFIPTNVWSYGDVGVRLLYLAIVASAINGRQSTTRFFLQVSLML